MKRRKLLSWSLVVLLLAALISGCSSKQVPTQSGQGSGVSTGTSQGFPQELIVSLYGGEYKDIVDKAVLQPFAKKYNVKIIYDESGSATEKYAKIRAAGGDPGFDLAIGTSVEPHQGAREGLLAPITEDKVPNLKYVYPKIREYIGQYGASHEIQYMTLVINRKYINDPIDSWSALWEPKYKGHVLVFDPANINGIYTLIMASVLAGGDEKNIEPGFKKMQQLVPQLKTTLVASSEAIPLVERGEVWLMPYWDGRAQVYKDKGLPIDFIIPKEGTIPLVTSLIIPKKAKHLDLAYKLIDFWLEKDIQRAWALGYKVGPSRGDIDLPADFGKSHVVSLDQLSKMRFLDDDYISKVRPGWTERWKRIFSK